MKLVLIGFMGSGKSTVSTMLCETLGLTHLDTDTLALSLSEQASIADIFRNEGESAFRKLELIVANTLRDTQNAVIATGGGMVMNQLAMDPLRQNAQVVYLKTSLTTVLERIGTDQGRPLLQDRLQLIRLYETRCALYEYYANWTVETDNLSPEDITQLIRSQLTSASIGKTNPA